MIHVGYHLLLLFDLFLRECGIWPVEGDTISHSPQGPQELDITLLLEGPQAPCHRTRGWADRVHLCLGHAGWLLTDTGYISSQFCGGGGKQKGAGKLQRRGDVSCRLQGIRRNLPPTQGRNRPWAGGSAGEWWGGVAVL